MEQLLLLQFRELLLQILRFLLAILARLAAVFADITGGDSDPELIIELERDPREVEGDDLLEELLLDVSDLIFFIKIDLFTIPKVPIYQWCTAK